MNYTCIYIVQWTNLALRDDVKSHITFIPITVTYISNTPWLLPTNISSHNCQTSRKCKKIQTQLSCSQYHEDALVCSSLECKKLGRYCPTPPHHRQFCKTRQRALPTFEKRLSHNKDWVIFIGRERGLVDRIFKYEDFYTSITTDDEHCNYTSVCKNLAISRHTCNHIIS